MLNYNPSIRVLTIKSFLCYKKTIIGTSRLGLPLYMLEFTANGDTIAIAKRREVLLVSR